MPDNLLQFDFSNTHSINIGSQLGTSSDIIAAYDNALAESLNKFRQWEKNGTYGFFSLPLETGNAEEALSLIQSFPAEIDTFLQVGIGGSSLGPIAIGNALDNHLTTKQAGNIRRVLVQENVDPEGFAITLKDVDFSRTVVNIVSKSGGTLETLANATAVINKMKESLSSEQISERLICCTENKNGALYSLAQRLDARIVSLPSNVGGRFSVLTAVGLVPAAAMGIDVHEMLAGAASMREQCFAATNASDPCFQYALIPHLLAKNGINIHVLFSYSDLLGGFSLWCRQLLAESLGKKIDRDGHTIHSGQTPLTSIGSVDQHSLLQLYMEGPADKLFTFFEIENFRSDETIGNLRHPDLSAEQTRDLTLGTLLNAERRGTTDALAAVGRPCIIIGVPEISAFTLGQLFYFFELSTAYAAELYNIDAFDQPGVEASKLMTLKHLRGDG